MKNIVPLIFCLTLLFSQYEIEGRWHLVGYEDNIMYQFEDNLRYSIYSIDGYFGDVDDAGGTPHPYIIEDDIITIDLHFGNVVSYQMNYICDGEVVEFLYNPGGYIQSTLFREGYNYIDGAGSCDTVDDCADLSDVPFGMCEMYLGVGIVDDECSYISGCGYEVDGIDYSNMFFDSLDECQESCNSNECEEGFIEMHDLCFHEGDIGVIQLMIDNSYESNIDLDCNDSLFCGSPNPYMDSPENWGWIAYNGTGYEMPGNDNGIVEPLELGIQEWENGRLTSFMCGAYIYCQLSGSIPNEIIELTEIETLRLELNYFSGFIPDAICELDINHTDYLAFDLTGNSLCPPYPECIDSSDGSFWYQETSLCNELGDINGDSILNVADIVQIIQLILDLEYNFYADLNSDGIINVVDVVQLVNLILN